MKGLTSEPHNLQRSHSHGATHRALAMPTATTARRYRTGCFTGLLPRSVSFLWAEMAARQEAGYKFTVRASFLEIYNEMVYDLWNPNAGSMTYFVYSSAD